MNILAEEREKDLDRMGRYCRRTLERWLKVKDLGFRNPKCAKRWNAMRKAEEAFNREIERRTKGEIFDEQAR